MIYEKMKEIRTYYLVTQQKMSEILEVSRSTYAGWENGIDPVSIPKLNEFCNYFKVSLDYVCGLSEEKSYSNYKQEIDIKIIGQRVKETRLNNNDTQLDIANFLNVDQSNYSKYELGKVLMRTYHLVQLAKHYNVSLDWLCGKIDVNPLKKD